MIIKIWSSDLNTVESWIFSEYFLQIIQGKTIELMHDMGLNFLH